MKKEMSLLSTRTRPSSLTVYSSYQFAKQADLDFETNRILKIKQLLK